MTFRSWRGALLGSCCASLLACAPSLFARESEMAKQAELRDDAAASTEHWGLACRAEPTNKYACDRERGWADKLRTRSLAAAKAPCAAGDLGRCLAALRDLGRLRPSDASAAELRRTAASVKRQGCIVLEKEGSLDSVLQRASCMYLSAAQFDEAGARELVLEERRHAAAQLVAASSGAPAASYVLLRTAQCLSPEVENGKARASATAFLAQASLPIFTKTEVSPPRNISPAGAGSVCDALARAIGDSVHCAPSAEGVPLDLTATVSIHVGDVQHTTSAEYRVAKYVSGTERVPNPERPSAERELDRAKRSFDTIEVEARDRQVRCQQSKMRDACDGYNAIQSTYNTRQEEYTRSKKRLEDTPPVIERDVVESVPYTVTHHLFAVPYTVSGTAAGSSNVSTHGLLSRKRVEQPGVAPAGVRAIPLVVPTAEEFDAEVVNVSADVVAPHLRKAIATRAVCATKSWSFDGSDLGCRATAELYLTGRLPDPRSFLHWLTC